MIDIHHHLLFDVDDGPKNLEASIAQSELAIADGITHVVCTPHASHMFEFSPERNRERLEAIERRVGSRLKLGLGCDFHLSYENIQDALKNPAKYTINGGAYLLVEFSDFFIPPSVETIFHEFALKGMRPIITHPERNPILQRDPGRIAECVGAGCLVQITASSLTGRWGKHADAITWKLLKDDLVHFVATDAHNLEGRRPVLRQAYEMIAKRLGEATAQRLFVANPLAAFENRELPTRLDPETFPFGPAESNGKRGLFSRWFGR